MSTKSIHPLLKPISWLEGTWVTENGVGQYPTIKTFNYGEKIQFKCLGQPIYVFTSDSWNLETKLSMHMERGFFRIKPETNNLSLILSHNFGLNTLEEGSFNEDGIITLKSTNIGRMAFAKGVAVTCVERVLKRLNDKELEVVISMATENTPLTEHLRAIYHKED